MAYDFRSSQIRTNKLITSGSTGTPAKLLVYDISADGTPANQGNIDDNVFASSSIGYDTFIYVSGSRSSLTGSDGGTVVFGGDVRTSGSFQAITETTDGTFSQPPHVLVNRNTGGSGGTGDGGVFIASVGNLSQLGSPYAGGLEFSIKNTFPSDVSYFPSRSQIVIQNESAGGIFLNSNSDWGGGGISIGVGNIDDFQAHNGEILIYTETSHLSMSALEDVHIKAGDDESSTVKFYTFAIQDPVELTDVNNTAITSSLANRTIVGAINELKVSASTAGGGGGSSVWEDAGTYIYNSASLIGATQQSTSTIVPGSFVSFVLGSAQSHITNTSSRYPSSSFIIGSTSSFVSGGWQSGIVGSRHSTIAANAESSGIYNSVYSTMQDPNDYGIIFSSILSCDTAVLNGGYCSSIIASVLSEISQSDRSVILGGSDSIINCEFGAANNVILNGFFSEIKTDGVGYSTIIGPGIKNHNSHQMHIGYGEFATYANEPLVVISGSTHFTSGSGATFFNGLSGSLTRLSNGASYLVAGTGIQITSASNGSVTIASTGGGGGGGGYPTRVTVGNYALVTQSSAQVVGGNYIVSTEHQTGSIELRTILSTTNSSNPAHIRLFSITDGYYLPIGGAGIFELNTTSTTPTVLTSSNLNSIITSSILLEVQVSGTLNAGSLAITHHNADLIFSD